MKHFFIFIFIFFVSTSAQSQNTDTNSVAYLMDDGNISNTKNIIKVNFISPIMGDVPFYYERLLGKYIGIEAGVGILLPYYGPEGLGILYEEKEIVDPGLGYSIWVQPKVYFFGKAPEYNYMGFQYRKRHYNLNNGQQIDHIDLTLNFGFQFFITNRLLLDYNIGIGFRQRKYSVYHSANATEGLIGIAMPMNLRLGFVF
jgi:hypothetical protein